MTGEQKRCGYQQVGEQVYWQRQRREIALNNSTTGTDITHMKTDLHTHTHTQLCGKLDMVILNVGPFGPVGGIGHMIVTQRSSAVCHSNSVSSS